MTILEYVTAFAASNLLSVKAFERECGLANGAVKGLTQNSRKSTWEKIKHKFPHFDVNDMFRTCCNADYIGIEISDEEDFVKVSRKDYDDLKQRVESQQNTINYLLSQLSKIN